jgi:hypothetical protein
LEERQGIDGRFFEISKKCYTKEDFVPKKQKKALNPKGMGKKYWEDPFS